MKKNDNGQSNEKKFNGRRDERNGKFKTNKSRNPKFNRDQGAQHKPKLLVSYFSFFGSMFGETFEEPYEIGLKLQLSKVEAELLKDNDIPVIDRDQRRDAQLQAQRSKNKFSHHEGGRAHTGKKMLEIENCLFTVVDVFEWLLQSSYELEGRYVERHIRGKYTRSQLVLRFKFERELDQKVKVNEYANEVIMHVLRRKYTHLKIWANASRPDEKGERRGLNITVNAESNSVDPNRLAYGVRNLRLDWEGFNIQSNKGIAVNGQNKLFIPTPKKVDSSATPTTEALGEIIAPDVAEKLRGVGGSK